MGDFNSTKWNFQGKRMSEIFSWENAENDSIDPSCLNKKIANTKPAGKSSFEVPKVTQKSRNNKSFASTIVLSQLAEGTEKSSNFGKGNVRNLSSSVTSIFNPSASEVNPRKEGIKLTAGKRNDSELIYRNLNYTGEASSSVIGTRTSGIIYQQDSNRIKEIMNHMIPTDRAKKPRLEILLKDKSNPNRYGVDVLNGPIPHPRQSKLNFHTKGNLDCILVPFESADMIQKLGKNRKVVDECLDSNLQPLPEYSNDLIKLKKVKVMGQAVKSHLKYDFTPIVQESLKMKKISKRDNQSHLHNNCIPHELPPIEGKKIIGPRTSSLLKTSSCEPLDTPRNSHLLPFSKKKINTTRFLSHVQIVDFDHMF